MEKRLEVARSIGAGLVQFDVADGTLTEGWVTWNEPEALTGIAGTPSLEAHLMVRKPEEHAPRWLAAGAKRIIFPLESDYDEGELRRLAREHHAELMVALNPETPLSALRRVPDVRAVLLLGVSPGRSGQTFQREALEKARALLAHTPDVTIEIDGGVTPAVAREARMHGVWGVAVGSYIFGSDDPKRAYEELWNS